MSTKSALKKKSRASLVEEAPKRKSEGSDDERENTDAVPAVVDKKMKKKKADTVSEALTELPENVAKTQDKKVGIRDETVILIVACRLVRRFLGACRLQRASICKLYAIPFTSNRPDLIHA